MGKVPKYTRVRNKDLTTRNVAPKTFKDKRKEEDKKRCRSKDIEANYTLNLSKLGKNLRNIILTFNKNKIFRKSLKYFHNAKMRYMKNVISELKVDFDTFWNLDQYVPKNIRVKRHLSEIHRLLVQILLDCYFLFEYKKDNQYIVDQVSKMHFLDLEKNIKDCNIEFCKLFEYFAGCITGLKMIEHEKFQNWAISLQNMFNTFEKLLKVF